MTTKKPHASACTKSPASSEESTASNSAKTAEKPPAGSVAGYVASASSKATKRAYASDVRHFIQHGGAIPATPAMVAEYLAKLAPIMKVATLERRCVSIAQAHRDQGLKSPTRADVVVATMKGIRRQHGTRQRAVKPLTRDVLLEMLPVRDDVQRAVDAMQKSDDLEALRAGVTLISQKFTEALRQKGVTEIEVLDKEFDADLSEAVARFAAGDEKKGKVIDVVQTGYKLGDKVLRFAKVVVGE